MDLTYVVSYDLARSSMVCSNHVFDVLKPHLDPLLSKGTDKKRHMRRADLIHDVLWITRTHELCPKDEAPNAGGKRTAAAAAGSSSSAQQDELMETFLAVYPFLAPMSDSFTYSILMVIFSAYFI